MEAWQVALWVLAIDNKIAITSAERIAVIQKLLEKNISPDISLKTLLSSNNIMDETTLLYILGKSKDWEAVRLFLKFGANPSAYIMLKVV